MKKNKSIKLLIAILITMTSCVSTGSDVEFFINKENTVQYFFPPKDWVAEDSNLNVKADWLYRSYTVENEEGSPRTVLNYTISSKKRLFRDVPKAVTISSENYSFIVPKENLKIIYIDKGKSRYSLWFYSEQTDELFRNADDKISITIHMDKDYLLDSTADFAEHIDYFKEVILGIYP